ncbi:MAG TPA: DUF1343 domain-containing protein [Chitinophagaceae bacterium]|nr:DUF1343 domain-containing protein [Chitinophagaceae bacterium]
MLKKISFTILFAVSCTLLFAQTKTQSKSKPILPGAYQTAQYLPLLKDKRIGILANQTSVIGNVHLIDTLLTLGVKVTKIFAPEHGFRGSADAGESVATYTDKQTGITVVSLYGKKLKPVGTDLKDVDVLLFDIQDVGVRFYTYISTLQYYIESAIQNDLPLIILDRPNPNGFYVDGSVLDTAYESFVGMQPVPVVYGMTIGEYAKMLLGEKWLSRKYERKQDDKISLGELLGFENESKNFSLTVIPCKNYTHKSRYELPVKPSPNLADIHSIYWYPSTCFFEGTVLSEGRGTEHPFCIFGHPQLPDTLFSFTPVSKDGAVHPKLENQKCYGWNVYDINNNGRLQLQWLLQAYQLFPDKNNFFIKPKKFNASAQDYFFNKLAGSDKLMQQIIAGKTEKEIRESWQPELDAFKKIRKKYLLYADFE